MEGGKVEDVMVPDELQAQLQRLIDLTLSLSRAHTHTLSLSRSLSLSLALSFALSFFHLLIRFKPADLEDEGVDFRDLKC